MSFFFNTLLHHNLLDTGKDGDDNPVYRTTHKGVRFIECCAQIKSLLIPPNRRKAGVLAAEDEASLFI